MIREVDVEKPEPLPPHKDDCGEHPPFFIPTQNRLTGAGEIITARTKCVYSCSRFCRVCNVCKFKCGHIVNHKTMIDNL